MSKKCSKCGKVKDVKHFYKKKSNKDGLSYLCKPCYIENVEERNKTKEGVCFQIYRTQRQNSLKRGHAYPSYTKKELRAWMYLNPKYKNLYNDWVSSGYKTDLKPSIDRIDDYKPYSFENIELTTWAKNNEKGHRCRRQGINNKQSISVDKINEKGEIISTYYSIHEAARRNGIKYSSTISNLISRKNKDSNGCSWRYSTKKFTNKIQ